MSRTYTDTPEPRYVERAKYAENGADVSPEQLLEVLEGDEFITADLNEEETKVQLSIDSDYCPWIVELEGNSGTLEDDDFAKLTISEVAQIVNNNEYYKKADVQEGFMVFIHNGRDNQQQIFSKAIYIYTDSESEVTYKTWTLVSTQVFPLEPGSIANEASDLGKYLKVGTTGPMWGTINNLSIDASSASAGQVLTADGNGGCYWA